MFNLGIFVRMEQREHRFSLRRSLGGIIIAVIHFPTGSFQCPYTDTNNF